MHSLFQPFRAAPLAAAALFLGAVPCVAQVTVIVPVSTHPFLDLHSHLFMKEGLGWMFHGDFNDDRQTATSWDEGFSSQANAATLEASQLGLVVVSLFASSPYVLDARGAIRKQIAMAEDFVKAHPDWVIAKTPAEAARAVADGKRVLVLSLEGAAGILETEADLREFVDEKGIRIVTFEHLMDDENGGAALLASYHVLSDPIGWIKAAFGNARHCENVGIKMQGLTPQGRELARKLLARHVWLDLTHASDETVHDLMPMLGEAGQPLLFTHTALRKYYGAERGLADWELDAVAASHGMVGVMPGHEMVAGTPVGVPPAPRPECADDDIYRLDVQYDALVSRLGQDAVAIGSDFNGAVPHLKPGHCRTGTSLDRPAGLHSVAQSGELWKAMFLTGADTPLDPRAPLRRFLELWQQVMPDGGRH